MSKVQCKCGEVIRNTEVPNDVEFHVYSNSEWHHKILIRDLWPVNELPQPTIDVWKCPHCQRILVFAPDGSIQKIYKQEY